MSDDIVDDVMNQRAGDIEKPATLPPGRWRMKVQGIAESGDTAKGNHEMHRLVFIPVAPVADVDEGDLEEYQKSYDLDLHRVYHRFMVRKDANDRRGIQQDVNRIVVFQQACDADMDLSPREFLSGAVDGSEFETDVELETYNESLNEVCKRFYPVSA